MRRIKRILLGIVCITFITLSFLQSNTKSSLNLHLESLLNISQAQAESSGNCSPPLYRKWSCGAIYGDGVDCSCTEREEVCEECN